MFGRGAIHVHVHLDNVVEVLSSIDSKLGRIAMSNAEFVAAVNAFRDQLTKALGELQTALGNAGNVDQGIVDAFNNVKNVGQQIDDLVPDAPPTP